jgi:hypothetical protein
MNELPLSRLEELENLSDRLARELELESKK